MSEYDALDAMVERMAREEQDDLDRTHGQFILDVATGKPQQEEDPLLSALNEAWRAELGNLAEAREPGDQQ